MFNVYIGEMKWNTVSQMTLHRFFSDMNTQDCHILAPTFQIRKGCSFSDHCLRSGRM